MNLKDLENRKVSIPRGWNKKKEIKKDNFDETNPILRSRVVEIPRGWNKKKACNWED